MARAKFYLGFLISTIAFSISASAAEVSPHLLGHLQSVEGPVDVMVYMNSKADLSFSASLVQRPARLRFVHSQLVKEAKRSQGAILKRLEVLGFATRSFHIENAVLVKEASSELVNELAARSDVRRVALDAKIPMKLPDNPSTEGQIASTEPLRMVAAPRVWEELGVRGEGIVVAGQDTGVRWDHESLINQYRGVEANGQLASHDYNWHDAIHSSSGPCGSSSAVPCDDHSHGTHTIGTVVGDNGRGVVTGVAPDAKWIACRNMDKGVGTVSTYLECFEFFLSPFPVGGSARENGDPSLAPHIVNNSWSCPRSEGCDGEEFVETIRSLNAAGILTVVSAGNDGPGCESVANPPGMYSGLVISVGAFNRYRREIAFFSSRGPSAWNGELAPTVTAPGSNIRSAVHDSRSSYGDKSGTSMAGPHVAGVAALLWSAKPDLIGDIETTMRVLSETSDPILKGKSCAGFPGRQHPNAVYGWGMVNAYRAITESD
ncbi:MAG: S8 family serine peptidase [Pseudomonadota bacterium]